MIQLVYTLLITGNVLLAACASFPSGSKTARATLEPGLFQQKETMLKEARAYKKLRHRVEQKTEEYSRIIAAYKAGVGTLAGREKYDAHVSLSKKMRDQSLAFRGEMYQIQPFCMVMGPCPTYENERQKLRERIESFDSLAERLRRE